MGRIRSLQAFRAIAFLFVFLSHTELIATGGIGVSMFLVLSGFLTAFSAAKKQNSHPVTLRSSIAYAAGKTKKLYPLHIVTLALMTAYTALLLWKNGFPATDTRDALIALPLNALLLQAWVPNEAFYFTFNKVSWYLSVCLFIYLVFPYIFSKLQKRSPRRLIYVGLGIVTVQTVIAALANTFLPAESRAALVKWIVYICPLFRSGDFFLGVILGLICLHGKVINAANSPLTLKNSLIEVAYVIAAVLFCTLRNRNQLPMWIGYGIIWLPFSLFGVYLFYTQKGIVTRLLSNKPLIAIGNLSAQAFLIHQMTIHLVKFLISDVYLLSAVSLILTLILSYCYEKIESRIFQQLKSR